MVHLTRSVMLLLLILLAACQGQSPDSPLAPSPTAVVATEALPSATPLPSPTAAVTSEPAPTIADNSPTEVPTAGEALPNGRFLTQEVEESDLTGDGQPEQIVQSAWQEGSGEPPLVLQVEVLAPDGQSLYTARTWTEDMEDPSTGDPLITSLYAYDRLEAIELRDLTGTSIPQLVIRQRRSGTGQFLVMRVVDFRTGVAQVLFDEEYYKGTVSFDEGAFRTSQALALYGEPNCCICRVEHTTYGWDGTRFVGVERVREAAEGADPTLCPSFPQPATWQPLEATNAPPPRRDAALVHDPSRNRVLLFGGRQAGTALDDTWALDLTTRTWNQLATGDATRPPARFSMVAGVDSVGERLFITTGQATDGSVFNDVWSFDLTTDTWEEAAVSGDAPAARYGSAGGIHSGEQRLLYLTHGFATTRFNDTWVLNLESLSWQNVTPEGTAPLNRCLHGAALRGSGSLVLFGGCSSGFGPCPQGDTWQFNLATGGWEVMSPEAGPPARQFPQLVALTDRDELLLFGGLGADEVALNDTWILEPLRSEWRKLEPGGTIPPARDGHSLLSFYRVDGDPTTLDGTMALLFGGTQAGEESNDLWLLTVGDE